MGGDKEEDFDNSAESFSGVAMIEGRIVGAVAALRPC
jgi:hypothetical protein